MTHIFEMVVVMVVMRLIICRIIIVIMIMWLIDNVIHIPAKVHDHLTLK